MDVLDNFTRNGVSKGEKLGIWFAGYLKKDDGGVDVNFIRATY